MMIESGDTSTDDTIALSALPYILLDMSDSGEGMEILEMTLTGSLTWMAIASGKETQTMTTMVLRRV